MRIIIGAVLMMIATIAVTTSEGATGIYEGYQVYSVAPQSKQQIEALRTLNNQYDVWTPATHLGRPAKIMVPPSKIRDFHQFLADNSLTADVLINNVQSLVDDEKIARLSRPKSKNLEWSDFHPLDEIYAWLDAQAAQFENVEVVTAGKTYEGRDIRALKITNGKTLPGVILESGIHAREWIGPAATSWIVNEILNSANDSVWRKFNYLYVPNLNPDGYVYTWTDERLWRKTRKPYANGCIGADPNRNFDNHWLEGGGASQNPCSETYGGPEPFSEIETKSYSEYLRNVAASYDLYIAFHSAAQLILFPWGWTPKPAPLHDLWQRVGDESAAQIEKVNGTIFEVGDIYETIYPASATSMDWYYGEFNSTMSYTFEMRSGYGFEIPPEFIIPCGKEHLAGLKSILDAYLDL